MRLNQWLAKAGVASRRGAEELIRAGRVRVNGVVQYNPAVRCRPGHDRVELDGRPLGLPPERIVIAFNKPRGYTTTRGDPHASRTIMELLTHAPPGLHPVGRLDRDSRGLLLLTNDGDLTVKLTHPRFGVAKVYRVRVRGHPGPRDLEVLRRGIALSDGMTAPAQVKLMRQSESSSTVEITVREGRKRQVRRMFAAIGHPVIDLQRIAVGPIKLGNLREGQWRRLSPAEIKKLEASVPDPGAKSQGGDPSSEP